MVANQNQVWYGKRLRVVSAHLCIIGIPAPSVCECDLIWK